MSRMWSLLLSGTFAVSLIAKTARAEDNSLKNITDQKVLRIAADLSEMPWIKEDSRTGKPMGFEYEFALFIASQIGKDIKLEYRNASWEKIIDDVRNRKADMAMNALFLPPEAERNPADHWTKCYHTTGLSVLYSGKASKEPSLNDLKKGKFGVFPEDKTLEYLKSKGISKWQVVDYSSKFKGLIEKGTLDYIIFDSSAAEYLAKTSNGVMKVSKTPMPGSEGCYAIMVRKDSQALANALDKAVDALNASSEKEKILAKYR